MSTDEHPVFSDEQVVLFAARLAAAGCRCEQWWAAHGSDCPVLRAANGDVR